MDRRQFALGAGAAVVGLSGGTSSAQMLDDVDAEAEADAATTVGQEFREIGGTIVPALGVPAPAFVPRPRIRVGPQGAPNADQGGTRSTLSRGQNYTVPAWSSELESQISSGVRYWRLRPGERLLSPEWRPARAQPDYGHLDVFGAPASEAFYLSAQVLSFLADRNAFRFADKRPVRVFGLRGCMLETDAVETEWSARHAVRLATPDHVETRCLIGLWRTSDNALRLYRASTVPQAANMYASIKKKGWGTSLLPTGLYRFRSGTHNAGTERPQSGALKNEEQYVVLRTTLDLSFDPHDPYDVWTIGGLHNIHAAGEGRFNPKFDSSGCQVIQGRYTDNRTNALGAWAGFRQMAGLAGEDGIALEPEPIGSGTYEYMLLTGLEAALAANRSALFERDYHRLRHGSSGERVRAAQNRLFEGMTEILGRPVPRASGRFGAETSFAALISRKLSEDAEYTTPVVVG